MIGFRGWIPPLPFAAGVVFQALAWTLVLFDAVVPSFGVRLAWVHAVALGWLTLTALAVLLHVTPEFTDLAWRAESVARAALGVALAGALGLVVAFAAAGAVAVEIAGGITAAAILTYALVALRTLAQPAADRTTAAIARALFGTLLALSVTVALGGTLARGFATGDARELALAPSHAALGIGAWLTVLVTGVSTRTFRPMLGIPRGSPRGHVAVGSALAIGAVLASIGAAENVVVLRCGVVVAACGAILYAFLTGAGLRNAATPHFVVRAFAGASATWLTVAAIGAVGIAFGVPLAPPIIVIALAGWLGQMVNAHLHHLGVRLLATLIRGEDDETRPWTVLQPQLGGSAWTCAQVAVAATAWRAAGGPGVAAWLGGSAGLAALALMIANAGRAIGILRRGVPSG